jgi:hypothetical protein
LALIFVFADSIPGRFFSLLVALPPSRILSFLDALVRWCAQERLTQGLLRQEFAIIELRKNILVAQHTPARNSKKRRIDRCL